MAKSLFFVLAALLVVAVVADFDFDDDDEAADIEFLKRDPQMQDLMLAHKRGSKINKYFACPQGDKDCWCNRRSRKAVFCKGGDDV